MVFGSVVVARLEGVGLGWVCFGGLCGLGRREEGVGRKVWSLLVRGGVLGWCWGFFSCRACMDAWTVNNTTQAGSVLDLFEAEIIGTCQQEHSAFRRLIRRCL